MIILRSGHAWCAGLCDASSRPHCLARAIPSHGGRRQEDQRPAGGGTSARWLVAGCGRMLAVVSAMAVQRRRSGHGGPGAPFERGSLREDARMNGQHGRRVRILTCVVAAVAVAVTWAGVVAPAWPAARGVTTGVGPPGAGDASAIGAARPAGSW